MKYIIGIDIGGTKINAILVDKNAKINRKIKFQTNARKGRDYVIKKILEAIEFVSFGIDKKNILGVGIGVPGVLDKKRETILNLPNLPNWKNIKLKDLIRKKTGFRILMENDGNCMALAESKFGAGRNIKNLVCLTLGTGIGGGIIINNRIYHGKGNAGEFGHMTINFANSAFKCHCGNKGCLETYVSVRGIQKIAENWGLREKEVIKIQQMARNKNKTAKKVYETSGKYLGIGLSNIVKMLDPELIVIGGGISKSGKLILKPAINEMKRRTFFNVSNVKLVKLGDNSGAIGAASLFLI